MLDVRCAPNIPPIPPHATADQLKSTMESLVKGDPDAWDMVTKGVRTKAQEFVRGGTGG